MGRITASRGDARLRAALIAGLGCLLALCQAGDARAQGTAHFPVVSIAGSRLECIGLQTVGGVIAYTYRVTNPATSDVGVESVRLDIGAPKTGPSDTLVSHGGVLFDATREPDVPRSHVSVEAPRPPGWETLIERDGFLIWIGPADGIHALEPVRAGGSREDFIVRSASLPGVRRFQLLPDYPYHCCPYSAGDPRNDSINVRTQEDFQSEGLTIGPTHESATVTTQLVSQLLTNACSERWVSDPELCRSLQAGLERAAGELARGDTVGARAQLRGFLLLLQTGHSVNMPASVNDQAFLLLRPNAGALLVRLSR
jgi:hypothetical protein